MKQLAEHVWLIPDFFSPSECEGFIRLANERGFTEADVRTRNGPQSMPQIRNNQRVQFSNPKLVSSLWERLRTQDLPILEGQAPAGLPRDVRFYAYTPGQRFKMHKDGPWVEDGRTSRLTLLVYLNDDFEGGATDFRTFQVQPRTGDAVVFVHATWHEGQPVARGTKYVLRSDVLYD